MKNISAVEIKDIAFYGPNDLKRGKANCYNPTTELFETSLRFSGKDFCWFLFLVYGCSFQPN